MQDSDTLVKQLKGNLKQAEASTNSLPIEAGLAISEPRPEQSYRGDDEAAQREPKDEIVDVINRVFVELKVAYHNKYHKAFPMQDSVLAAKQLWFDALNSYSPNVILRACRQAIAESEYLPSLHMMLRQCANQLASVGLPDSHSAYREACNAPEPKCNAPWSHVAVYYAAAEADWFMLASETEARMLPVFERCYQRQCERVLSGEQLPSPRRELLGDTTSPAPLSKQENQLRIKALREELKL